MSEDYNIELTDDKREQLNSAISELIGCLDDLLPDLLTAQVRYYPEQDVPIRVEVLTVEGLVEFQLAELPNINQLESLFLEECLDIIPDEERNLN